MFQKLTALTLCLILLAMPALADADHVLTLPGAMTEVQEEAFMGLGGIEQVILPEGLRTIGDRAFADIPTLCEITIPQSVTEIGEDIVSGSSSAILVKCAPGSEAMSYARNNNLDYDANTRYRVLAIGETYPGTDNQLNGPDTDMATIEKAFKNLSGINFEVVTALNPVMADFDKLIASTFPANVVQDQDVSIFYYSGHGTSQGNLIGSDWKNYSPTRLKQALDAVPGRKFVIIDACYSGRFLDNFDIQTKGVNTTAASATQADATDDTAVEDFNDAFLSAFQPVLFRKGLSATEFFVLTACSRDQTSFSIGLNVNGAKRYFGIFTHNLCEAIGWNERLDKANATMKGDANGDDAVSITEAYNYAKNGVNTWIQEVVKDGSKTQDVQVYPAVCNWFAPFRN